MLKEHGETPTLAGLREAVLRVLCHWDLWLPLETLPAFPRRQLQGKANVSSALSSQRNTVYIPTFALLTLRNEGV